MAIHCSILLSPKKITSLLEFYKKLSYYKSIKIRVSKVYRMKKEKAYAYIKRLILDGKWDLKEPINVNEITEHLKMSRTPIHKALSQLEQEGFLTIIPQVGVFVRKPKKSEVMERILVCSNLDTLLTEQAVPKISEETIDYLEDLLK